MRWHLKRKFTVMQEPAYILKNGTPVPYIPGTITTSRDAYAASLHVLFKHVADFHICIVQTFSAKYGIPEDDILKTIQESEEFQNMLVDPVLDTDINSLGYLDEATKAEVPPPATESPKPTATKAKPVASKAKKTKTPPVADIQVPVSKELMPEEEAHEAEAPVIQEPVPKTKPVASKSKKTKNTEAVEPVEPIVEAPIVESHVIVEESRPEPEIKTKTIRKKVVVPKPATTSPATTSPATTAPATSAPATAAPATAAPATSAPATTAPATTAPATKADTPALALAIEGDVPRKIIKKKTMQPLSK